MYETVTFINTLLGQLYIYIPMYVPIYNIKCRNSHICKLKSKLNNMQQKAVHLICMLNKYILVTI